ncbi:MAG: helix-turn-helix transcriptional regulator, partial [Actinomycetota bacterium]|nr:helix-turn-helix transcriptional regulator [Actinomycetota bacterium]
ARIAFEDAVRLYRHAGVPYEEAQARLALARELGAVGRSADGLRHAKAAAQELHRIGAVRAAGQADNLVRSLAPPSSGSPLTRRERQVLGLVADGLTNRGIAARLVVSEHTVNRHVTNIFTKLGVRSRASAVAEAVRRDWL